MDAGIKVAFGSMSLFISWMGLRLLARNHVNKMLRTEYNNMPDVLGPLFTSAANGFIVLKSSPEASLIAISLLTEELLPMIGFNIPTEENVVIFIAQKLSVPTGIPQKAIEPVVAKALKYGKTETDEQFIKEEIQLLISGILKQR